MLRPSPAPEKELVGIEITTAPTKVDYVEGELVDTTGMIVTATYDDESTEAVTGYTYEPTGPVTVGDTLLKVEYQGFSDNTALNVVAKEVESISCTNPPDKTEYTVGEVFDPTGMEITARYNDASHVVVTDYTYEPTEALTVDDTEITISYGGKTCTTNITVTE